MAEHSNPRVEGGPEGADWGPGLQLRLGFLQQSPWERALVKLHVPVRPNVPARSCCEDPLDLYSSGAD